MATIDYEKKYKEALGWMQNLYNGLHGKTKEEAERYFPELKDEDERIRKDIVTYLKSTLSNKKYGDKVIESWIAWLEKQGDKTAWSEDDKNRINRLIAYFEDKESFTAEDDVVYANWLKDLKDRVQPQPKREWSEEDDKKLKWLCRIIHSCKIRKEISLAEESEIGSWVDKWLNYAPQSQWKPSDEQMKALDNARHSNPFNVHVLDTLFHDLEKIKGGKL